jgi:hypothetical protein
LAIAALLGAVIIAAVGEPEPLDVVAQQSDPRYFSETGYRIDNEGIWDYYIRRGRSKNFGFPTSRTFQFQGATTQFFQRQVVQLTSSGPRLINLLDADFLPYTRINGSVFPAADPSIAGRAPQVGSPGYAQAVVEFVRDNAPDTFDNEPVRFFETFNRAVTVADAFPSGQANPGLLPLLNLEIWGLPTSKPARDPSNGNFIYLRFQRGIMHYDAGCKCTQGLLLADYLKALITGQNLPADLAQQARTSPFYDQYDWDIHSGPRRPGEIDANLPNAFRPSRDNTEAQPPPATRTPTAAPTSTRGAPTTPPTRTPTPTATRIPRPSVKGDPKDLVIKEDDAGKNAEQELAKAGYDAKSVWYEVRYEKKETFANFRSGPTQIYQKAILAVDTDTARKIYDEQVKLNTKFPEATKRTGDQFEWDPKEGDEDVGDEAVGFGACERSCDTGGEIYIHRRVVFIINDLVGVTYTYGLDNPEGNTKANTRYVVSILAGRWR